MPVLYLALGIEPMGLGGSQHASCGGKWLCLQGRINWKWIRNDAGHPVFQARAHVNAWQAGSGWHPV